MTAHYTSKHGQVAKRPEELYMAFTDMRTFAQMVPQDKVKAEITACISSRRRFRAGPISGLMWTPI